MEFPVATWTEAEQVRGPVAATLRQGQDVVRIVRQMHPLKCARLARNPARAQDDVATDLAAVVVEALHPLLEDEAAVVYCPLALREVTAGEVDESRIKLAAGKLRHKSGADPVLRHDDLPLPVHLADRGSLLQVHGHIVEDQEPGRIRGERGEL